MSTLSRKNIQILRRIEGVPRLQKIINLDDLLRLLRNLGVTEQNIKRIEDDLTYPRLFAA